MKTSAQSVGSLHALDALVHTSNSFTATIQLLNITTQKSCYQTGCLYASSEQKKILTMKEETCNGSQRSV